MMPRSPARLLPRLFWALLLMLPAAQGGAHPAAQTSISRLDQLITEHPREQALFIQRAALLAHQSQWQAALDDLEHAQTLGDPAAAAFELGLLRYHRGEYAQAMLEFSRFLARHPGNPDALLYRARAAQADGRRSAAVSDFEAYIARAQQPHPGDLLAAARLLATQGEAGIGAAISLLDQGMDTLGLQAQLQRYAIQLELQRDQLGAAVQRCRELATILGNSPRWQVEMAELLLLAEHRNEAVELLEEARLQLQQLRPTPARAQLRHRIEGLH